MDFDTIAKEHFPSKITNRANGPQVLQSCGPIMTISWPEVEVAGAEESPVSRQQAERSAFLQAEESAANQKRVWVSLRTSEQAPVWEQAAVSSPESAPL